MHHYANLVLHFNILFMRTIVCASFFVILNICFISTKAQIKFSPAGVKEIVIHNTVWGLGGGTTADIKVIKEAGQWRSYLTRKESDRRMGAKQYDSTLHKLIAILDPAVLNNMLNGIAVIKPAVSSSTYNLTASKLITELKKGAKTPIMPVAHFEKLITQKTIDDAIAKTVIEMDVMDDYEYCEVDIINRNNDTVKLNTQKLCPTKLPWTINKHPTYDMAINNFVVAAMGAEDIPNKRPLSINSIKEAIYNYIDGQNAGAPIGTFKWNYYYPENLKLLKEHFMITEKFSYDNIYNCALRTNTMPTNATVYCRIDMADNKDIKTLIDYAALIDAYFKSNNFVLQYYSNRPKGYFSFWYYTGQSHHSSLLFLSQKLPELAKIDSTKTIAFYAGEPDDTTTWIIFPNNDILLTYHSFTAPNGQPGPIFPPMAPNTSWNTRSRYYYLFDGSGKVLSEGNSLY